MEPKRKWSLMVDGFILVPRRRQKGNLGRFDKYFGRDRAASPSSCIDIDPY